MKSSTNNPNKMNNSIKPPPKPGQVKVFKALYDYKAQNNDELSFQEGDILYVIDMVTHKNWWKAKCNEKVGLVPCNYIEESTENVANPLHEAAKRGNIEFMKECLANKVSVNSLDKAGNTPLHWAAYGGHLDCVNLLLKCQNIAVNVQNKLGDSPLHNAAYKGHVDIVKVLIERDSRLDLLNYDLKAPFDLTMDNQCKALLQYNINREAQSKLYTEYLDDGNNDSD